MEIGNPIPEAQLNPPHDVAGIRPHGLPRNTTPCLERQLEKYENPEGKRRFLKSWLEGGSLLTLFSLFVMFSASETALGPIGLL